MATLDHTAAKFKVEPLSGDNYYIWQRRMKTVLMAKKFWNIVTGREVAPTAWSDSSQLSFLERSQNSLSTIVMAINDDCYGSTIDTEDPRVLWEDLKAKYNTTSATAVSNLQAQYLTVKMMDCETITKYVDRVSALEKRLTAMGKEPESNDKLNTLLRGLQSRFDVTRDLILELGRDSNKEIQMLLAKEAQMDSDAHGKSGESEERALFASHTRGKCFECGQDGHYKRDCTKVKTYSVNRNSRGQGNSRRGQRGRGQHTTHDKEGISQAFITFLTHHGSTGAPSDLHRRWFVDSGASRHMTNDDSNLENMVSSKDSVEVGEGTRANIEEVGTIRATVSSEGLDRNILISDIAYVPSLTTNLLSVSCLRRRGLSVLFSDVGNDPNRGQVSIMGKMEK